MCTFLLQIGALWNVCLIHCGICEMGLCTLLSILYSSSTALCAMTFHMGHCIYFDFDFQAWWHFPNDFDNNFVKACSIQWLFYWQSLLPNQDHTFKKFIKWLNKSWSIFSLFICVYRIIVSSHMSSFQVYLLFKYEFKLKLFIEMLFLIEFPWKRNCRVICYHYRKLRD